MSHSTDAHRPATDTTREPSVEVLDGNVFQELVESLAQPDAVAAVYRKFLENAAAFIGELRDLDAAARIETLHTLKGSAAMMGANSMAGLAAQLQAQGASVQVEAATRQLGDELTRLRAAIEGRLLALGAAP